MQHFIHNKQTVVEYYLNLSNRTRLFGDCHGTGIFIPTEATCTVTCSYRYCEEGIHIDWCGKERGGNGQKGKGAERLA